MKIIVHKYDIFMHKLYIVMFASLFYTILSEVYILNIIPTPKIIKIENSEITLKNTIVIFCDKEFDKAKKLLQSILANAKKTCVFNDDEKLCDIHIIKNENLQYEEYEIECKGNSIYLRANSQNGALYAIETFRQLAKLDFIKGDEKIKFKSVYIKDSPQHEYRGLHFDVARHFFNRKEIFEVLEQMSRMKLNVFHFHLTDDQGFRIPLKKHSKISEVGSTRYGTEIKLIGRIVDNKEYSHIYSLEDLKEIVDYADSLGIEIIPEMDLPGHMVAVISAYNELSCTGKPIEVRKKWGVSKDILCAGEKRMYEVICDILDEICDIFPSKYIHLGGDEAPKDRWRECPKCQSLMKEKGLKNEDDLQGYVFNYFCNYLKTKNKIVIGWNDCLNDELNDQVILEHWTTDIDGIDYQNTLKHINNGRKGIISGKYYYFDHPYGKISLKDTYDYDIYLEGIAKAQYKNIIGAECCVWTEWITSREKLQFNLFPRLAVFAECVWVDKKLPYDEVVIKLKEYYKVYEANDIYYARNMENKNPHTPLNRFIDEITKRLKKPYREVNKQLKSDKKALL